MTNTKQIGLIFILIVILFGVGYFYNLGQKDEGYACTLDARLCPDGSYVGRSGPKCEFTPCPLITEHSNWKTSSNGEITFQYPEKFSTTYISEIDWPPQTQLINEPYSCLNAGTETERAGKTETKIINGHAYCVTTLTEGAAGSTYKQFAYAKAFNDQTVIFTFTIREPQCMNYNEPTQTECLNEQKNFSVDTLIDEIISTLQINR